MSQRANHAVNNDRINQAHNAIDHRLDSYVNSFSWIMPFGRHKGKPICSVPVDYLRFIRNSSNNTLTCRKCAEELDRQRRLEHI